MRPIFIGGCPRSGTTFLGSLLGGHSRIICVPESEFIGIVSQTISSEAVIDDSIAGEIMNHWRFRYWGLDDRKLLAGAHHNTSLRAFIEMIVREYSEMRGKRSSDMWVDHTPNNLHYIHALVRHFPDAVALHIIRDARAVAASIMPLDWGPNSSMDAADLWVRETGIGLAAKERLPDKVMNIHYESLVLDTENQLGNICNFAGIPYESSLRGNSGFTVPRYSRKQHALVGKAPDRSRIAAWKRRLTNRDIEIIESRTQSMMALLGYTDLIHEKPRPVRWNEIAASRILDIIWRKWIQKIRLYQRTKE